MATQRGELEDQAREHNALIVKSSGGLSYLVGRDIIIELMSEAELNWVAGRGYNTPEQVANICMLIPPFSHPDFRGTMALLLRYGFPSEWEQTKEQWQEELNSYDQGRGNLPRMIWLDLKTADYEVRLMERQGSEEMKIIVVRKDRDHVFRKIGAFTLNEKGEVETN